MNKLKTLAIPIVFIFTLGLFLQYTYLNEFPSHIHAWSQSDRYSIALGFERNNLNFFKPETYVLNHQFPDDFKKPHQTSITSVDFPIHDYIPAVIMKISDSTSPAIFRIYILFFSFLGLFFLFKLSYLFNKNTNLSLLIVLLAATSPLYVYYQSGFIPSIPCISLAIIGLYHYFDSLLNKKTSSYYLGLIFLTLAALSRSTFVIPLLAICGFDIALALFEKQNTRILLKKGFSVAMCFSVFIGYFWYNSYLRNKYGSIFLNELMPASSFSEAKEILKAIKDNWKWHYFSKWHYLVFALLSLCAAFYIIKGKYKTSKNQYSLLVYTLVYLIGSLFFVLAMLKQFPAHDYYFLDSLFIPILLFLILTTSFIQISKKKIFAGITVLFLIIISVPLIINAKKMQEARRETGSWDRTTATINNFENADLFLDSLNISKTAKFLVLDAYAPNIPFIKIRRKGYAVMTTNRENIIQSLTWNFDYIIIQNEFFITDVYNKYPEIVTRIEKIGDNGRISLCKLASKNKDLNDFLKLSAKKPLLREIASFDAPLKKEWSNVTVQSEMQTNQNPYCEIESKNEFGLTYKSKKMKCMEEKPSILQISFRIFNPQSIKSCEAICAINQDKKNSYYFSFALADFVKTKNEWKPITLTYYLPPIISKNYEFSWYFWNKDKEELNVDDIEIKVFD